jgi:hypothetical protein
MAAEPAGSGVGETDVTVAGAAGVLVEVVEEEALEGDEAQPKRHTDTARPRRAANKTEQFFIEPPV